MSAPESTFCRYCLKKEGCEEGLSFVSPCGEHHYCSKCHREWCLECVQMGFDIFCQSCQKVDDSPTGIAATLCTSGAKRVVQTRAEFMATYTGPFTVRLGGAVISNQNFRDGKKHGPQESFFPDGTIMNYTMYVEGEKHGEELQYDMSGAIIREAFYKNGRLHGRIRDYEDGGKLFRETLYEEGVGTLLWSRYQVA